MIASYARHGRYEAALELFETMLSSGMNPTPASFTAALGACLDSGALATGRRIHEYASASKEELDLTVRNALVGMYGKCGSIEDASRIFSETEEKSLLSWNTMLAAYSQNDRGRRNALDLLNKMLLEGFQPNGATFVSVLSACSHSGRFAEGCAKFTAMQTDHGVAADAEHYGCMVDLFGRLGRLAEAENAANYAPKGGDRVSWLNVYDAAFKVMILKLN